MFTRSRLRIIVALTFAITAVGAVAAPAAAETTLVNCQGTCGYYEVYDMGPPYGANCIYERISEDLDSMSARPPLMHGNYGSNSTVQWRFKILRAGQSSMSYSTIYTSSKQAAVANDATPAYAGSGFSRRTYTASENPSGKYKMQIEMWWKHHGSVEGYAKIEYDHYKQLKGGATSYDTEYCTAVW